MAFEIERKFLIKDDKILSQLKKGKQILQGYLSLDPDKTVRVRLVDKTQAFITIKSRISEIKKYEFEYQIPVEDAIDMIQNICIRPVIEKKRFTFLYKSHKWEIDVFYKEFSGIVLAEIELSNEKECFERPSWIGLEVTNNPDYHNANMVKNYNIIKY